MYYIGIDTGVHTGVAVWNHEQKQFIHLFTMPIHQALEFVRQFQEARMVDKVFFEDARQRRWIPDTHDLSREMGRRQGAGSVKRDAKIWEDFCTDLKIPFEMVAPQRGGTKWSAETFANVTGWKKKTSEHARDAALLVYGK